MINRNGYLRYNDLYINPHPTYEMGYNSLVEMLRPFYEDKVIRYMEPGKGFSSAIIILNDKNVEKVNKLPSGVYSTDLPKMCTLKNCGFKDIGTGLELSDEILDAVKHQWLNGITISNHEQSVRYLKEFLGPHNEVALALAAAHPEPGEENLKVKIRAFGSEAILNELLKELEKIPLAVKIVDAMRPTFGKNGLGNNEIVNTSDNNA